MLEYKRCFSSSRHKAEKGTGGAWRLGNRRTAHKQDVADELSADRNGIIAHTHTQVQSAVGLLTGEGKVVWRTKPKTSLHWRWKETDSDMMRWECGGIKDIRWWDEAMMWWLINQRGVYFPKTNQQRFFGLSSLTHKLLYVRVTFPTYMYTC